MKRLKDFIIPCRVSSAVLNINADGVLSDKLMNTDGDIAAVFVTGEAVGSRNYDTSDPIVRRIEANPDLYVSVHDNATIDYVRRAVVDSFTANLGCRTLGIVVCGDIDSLNMDAEVEMLRRRRLSLSALRKDIPLSDYLASKYLKMIRLPVLLVYLAVLLANFFIHSGLTEDLDQLRLKSARESVEAKRRSVVTHAQAQLYSVYQTAKVTDMSWLSDAVASLVPDDILLTSLSFKGLQTRICGDAFSSEAVVTFVDSLRDTVECETVNMVTLERDSKEDLFRFEIHIMR